MIFCTLFNWAYLPHGLALYRSLERVCKGDLTLHVLCIDDFTADVLHHLKLPHVRSLRVADIEDDALRAARADRSIGEFCWTCTSVLLLHLLKGAPPDEVVTYVDADMCFFSDPRVVLSELGSGSILVHEHGFAPEHAHLMREAGRFNVGLVSFRNDAQGRACLERWKEQCLAECKFDPAAGKCGDQNYLDEWPSRYPGLVISSNPGVGLAPWNIAKYRLANGGGMVTVDGRAVVFYHYHSLKLLRPRMGFSPIALATGGYALSEDIVSELYVPYTKELWRALRRVEASPPARKLRPRFAGGYTPLPLLFPQLLECQLLFLLRGMRVPARRNARLVQTLYGL
jgi:hypothetical protein